MKFNPSSVSELLLKYVNFRKSKVILFRPIWANS